MDHEFGLRSRTRHAVLAYDPTMVVWAPVDPAMLSKRYFRRWAFKAGISQDETPDEGQPKFLLVPRWVYRQLLQDVLHLPKDLLFSSQDSTFIRELRIWRLAGTIASYWYARLWPEKYPKWVAHYSQKKKNLY
jgi:hypothetical protein